MGRQDKVDGRNVSQWEDKIKLTVVTSVYWKTLEASVGTRNFKLGKLTLLPRGRCLFFVKVKGQVRKVTIQCTVGVIP
jgi:hypothetical protein